MTFNISLIHINILVFALTHKDVKSLQITLELVDQFPIFKDFKRIAKEDMTLLGAPILEGKAVDEALKAKIMDLERSVERLSLL